MAVMPNQATPTPAGDNSGSANSVQAAQAQAAAAALGLNPTFVLKQWALETGNFTSPVYLQDNNPAGIEWYPGMTYGTKGQSAGGGKYYAKFNDPTTGYVNFILHNPVYLQAAKDPTVKGEASIFQKLGWATDPQYANKIVGMDLSVSDGTGTGTDPNNPLSGQYGPPSGSIVTNPGGYIGAFLWVILGIVLMGLGIYIAMNPFSDLTSAIRDISKTVIKKPFSGVTDAVRNKDFDLKTGIKKSKATETPAPTVPKRGTRKNIMDAMRGLPRQDGEIF